MSRLIDRYCNRHFWVLVTSKKFDGDGGTELPIEDLISVTSLKTDDNKDRTFETTWAATDYLLYPANAEPTKEWGRPYTRVLVDLEAGSEDVVTTGRQTVQIEGKWGFREVTEDSGADINEGAQFSATDTTLTVTGRLQVRRGRDHPHRQRTAIYHSHLHQRPHRHQGRKRHYGRGPQRQHRYPHLQVSTPHRGSLPYANPLVCGSARIAGSLRGWG